MSDNDQLRDRILELERQLAERDERIRVLEEGARVLDALVDAVPGDFYLFDAQGRFVRWNQHSLRRLGYTGDELQELGALGPILDEDRPAVEDAIEQALRGARAAVTFRDRSKDGRVMHNFGLGRRVDIDGEPHLVGVSIELTDLAWLSQRLEESQSRYQVMVENLPVVAWSSDASGENHYISPSVERVYGFTPAEIHAAGPEAWFGRVHPEDVERVRRAIATLFDTGEPFGVEYRIRHKEGHWIWLHDRASQVVVIDGEQRVTGVFWDITERKRIEDELLESAQRYRRLWELASDGMFLVTPDGVISDCNAESTRLLGRRKEEIIGRRPSDLSPPFQPDGRPSREAALEFAERVLTGERPIMPWRHLAADGGVLEVEVSGRAVQLHGQPHVLARVWDQTERRRTQRDLALLRLALEQVQTAVLQVDEGGAIRYANPAACRSLGYSRDELHALSVEALDERVPPGGWAKSMAYLETSGVTRFETRHRRADGSTFPVELLLNLVEQGGERFVLAFAVDITRRKRLDAVHEALELSSGKVGAAFLEQATQQIAELLAADVVLVGELVGGAGEEAQTAAFWMDGALREPARYALAGTPCEDAIRKELCSFPRGVAKRFPDDAMLSERGIESYAGTPLLDTRGQPIGVLAAMGRRPFEDPELVGAVLRVFSVRASAELERQAAERAIAVHEDRLRALSQHLLDVREEEQKRIARELHDELGSTLTALRLDLGWMASRVPGAVDGVWDRVADMERLVEDLSGRVRDLAAQLRPGLLDHLGLGAAAQWLVSRTCERAGLACELFVVPEDLRLDETRSVALYRVLQEALTNVVRHAEASTIDILIECSGGRVSMSVRDDGVGFSLAEEARPDTFGLLGIRERVRLLEGTVDIQTGPGQGTVLIVGFPSRKRSERR